MPDSPQCFRSGRPFRRPCSPALLQGGILLLSWLGTLPGPLAAQAPDAGEGGEASPEPSPDGSPAQPVVEPPRIEEYVEAEHPPVPLEEGRGATVELELTVLPDGTVDDVAVVGPAGEGFDEAAVQAVQRFRFQPATRDGEPIPARIRYRYVFEAPAPVVEEPAAPQVGRLSGQVLSQEDQVPIGGADVLIASEDGAVERRVVAGEDGGFVFDGLPPGSYSVLVVANEFGEETYVEEVAAGQETNVVYRFVTDGGGGGEDGFAATAVVDAPPREVTRRTIESEELIRVPGTRGDALRAVELLPGVGRPPFGAGILIVRGAAPQDSQIFFEGGPVPLLYHFGGLTSFINSRLLERIDFYPGNFSVKYGRATGGVLEVTGRDPAMDGFHGVVDVNVIDASFLFEGPVAPNLSVAAAARRSYIDFFFENVVPDDAFDTLAAPVYYDYQTFATWTPTERDRVRLIVFGSSDEFRAFISDPDDEPSLTGNLTASTSFHRVYAGWRHQYSDALYQDLSISYGVDFNTFGLGEDLRFEGDFQQIQARAEWGWQVAEPLKLRAGMDIFASPFDIRFAGPPPGPGEGDAGGGNVSDQETINVAVSGVAYRPAAYLEADWRPLDRLQFVGGIRADYAREIEEWAFDPRLAVNFQLDERWRIKGGVGLFSQPPEFQESTEEEGIGNPNLEFIKSLHVSAGFERVIVPGIDVGLEGFYKYLWDRPIQPSTLASDRPFVSEGLGRIYGAELSGRWRPGAEADIPIIGFFSYTLSRSERRDGEDAQWRLFDFDQTHILTIAGTYIFGDGWEAGGTFRLVTGNPTTPFEGATVNVDSGLYTGLPGRVNSERAALFHRLDVRIQKEWRWARGGGLSPWRLAVYLDIQNVYNRMNPEGVSFNYDYTEQSTLSGLPIIPSLGIRGEL